MPTTIDTPHPQDELLEAYLAQHEAVCPACSVYVNGVAFPYLCPGCGHRLSLGLKGDRPARIARPWMFGLFGLGVLALGPMAAMVVVAIGAGNGHLLVRNVMSIVWVTASMVGALVSVYALTRLLGRPSARVMSGDLGEYRPLAWIVVGSVAAVATGRFLVPMFGAIMP